MPNQIISLERRDSRLKRHQELIQIFILNAEWHIPVGYYPWMPLALSEYLGISIINLLSDLLLQVIKKDALDFRIQRSNLVSFLRFVSCEGC